MTERRVMKLYMCEFCGLPTDYEPGEQSPPPAYCHIIDHVSYAREPGVEYVIELDTGLEYLILADSVDDARDLWEYWWGGDRGLITGVRVALRVDIDRLSFGSTDLR